MENFGEMDEFERLTNLGFEDIDDSTGLDDEEIPTFFSDADLESI
jgi:hypothetical protein